MNNAENLMYMLSHSVMSDSLRPNGLYVVHQAPLSMGFSREEHWSGLPFLPSGNLPDPGIKCMSFVSPALAGRVFTTEPPGKPVIFCTFKSYIFIYLAALVLVAACGL